MEWVLVGVGIVAVSFARAMLEEVFRGADPPADDQPVLVDSQHLDP